MEWSRGSVLDDRDVVERLDSDVRDYGTMDRVLQGEAIDTVIHLAAHASVGSANDDRADLRAQAHPLEAPVCHFVLRAKDDGSGSGEGWYL